MNIEELEEELIDLLGCTVRIARDKNKRLVIYTNLVEMEDGELEPEDNEDHDDEEPDELDDMESLDALEGDEDDE